MARDGGIDEAINAFKECSALDPILPEPYLNLGALYLEKGNHRLFLISGGFI